MDIPKPMVFEAETHIVFLPGCPSCGDRHPLAYKPARHDGVCPSCGIPRPPPGDAVLVESAITDSRVRFGNALSRVGAALNRLARRI